MIKSSHNFSNAGTFFSVYLFIPFMKRYEVFTCILILKVTLYATLTSIVILSRTKFGAKRPDDCVCTQTHTNNLIVELTSVVCCTLCSYLYTHINFQ